MTDQYDEKLLRVAADAATAAGNLIAKGFSNISSVTYKSKANPVTDVDLAAEETIVNIISSHFPEHNLLAEEGHTIDRGSEYTWVIDPLDGTVNFTQGIPLVAVSVGLAFGDTPLLGAVYDPVRKELFSASRGKGAFLNGKPITVSKKQSLQNAVVGVDLGYEELARHRALETTLTIRPKIQSIRLIGSAVLGLCYAACSRFDVYFHPHVYPWDLFAGSILVEEAGGKITDLYGKPITKESSNVAAANHELYQQFMDVAAHHLMTG